MKELRECVRFLNNKLVQKMQKRILFSCFWIEPQRYTKKKPKRSCGFPKERFIIIKKRSPKLQINVTEIFSEVIYKDDNDFLKKIRTEMQKDHVSKHTFTRILF